jgi:type IVB pilus formation R64 PilN family outer membrane protein
MRLLATIAACLGLSLSGCQQVHQADKGFDKRMQQADQAFAGKAPRASLGGVIRGADPVLGTLEQASEHGDALPARCSRAVTLQVAEPKTLTQLKELITQETGVPVEIDPRVYNDPDDKSSASAAPPQPSPGAGQPGFPFLGRAPIGSSPTGVGPASITPNFHGSCDQVFDQIASSFDLSWRMNGRTLSFDKYVTRTLVFRVSDASTKTQASLSSGGNSANSGGGSSSGGSGGGQGGNTTQTSSYEINSDVWAEIENGLKTLLPRGSRYTISRTAGVATITTTPRVAKDIGQWADQMNAILGTTISVEIAAIYITVNDNDNYALDLSALYQAGTQGGVSAGLSGLLPSLSTTGGSGSVAILNPATGGNNFNTHFAGSQIFLNAVSTSQRLADFRTATATGRNGVPMPITLTTNQDIVRSLTNAVGLQTGTTSVTAQTSTINYGFSLTALPRVIAPGVVNVFLSFSANDLTNLQNFQVGNTGSVELATIDNRTVWTEMPLKSGQTLVLAGTEQEKVNRTDQGLGDSWNFLLGGQKVGGVVKTRLVLLVTPTIIAAPK